MPGASQPPTSRYAWAVEPITAVTSLPRNRRTDAFERRVAALLRALGVLESSAPVVVACSGGPDSTATLVALARALGAERVTAAHFDHRLRDAREVARERALVAEVAGGLGAAVVTGRAARRPATDSEDAARAARYRWLARACQEAGAPWCVTGHTLDDQAETVLLRLARGAGATGAAGMAAEAEWPVRLAGARSEPAPRVVRPLLDVTREEVERYLKALGIQGAQDPSNASLDYARNRVRARVLPELRVVNARAAEHLARFAALQREDDEALGALARAWVDQHGRMVAGGMELDRVALRAAPPALARRAVRVACARLGIALEASHIAAILGTLTRRGARVDLPVAYSESGATVLTLRTRPSPPGTD